MLYLVVVYSLVRVAELADESRYWSPVHCWSMISLTSVGDVKAPEMPGQGSGSRLVIVAVAKTNLMQQLRHGLKPVVVDVKSETFDA